MRVERHRVFGLARLDAAQAADAFRGIDSERPTMLGPIVSRDCRRRGFAGRGCRGLSRNGAGGDRCGTARQSAAETGQKFATLLFVLLEFVLHVHVAMLPNEIRFRCRLLAGRAGVIGRHAVDVRVAHILDHAGHHRVLARAALVGLERIRPAGSWRNRPGSARMDCCSPRWRRDRRRIWPRRPDPGTPPACRRSARSRTSSSRNRRPCWRHRRRSLPAPVRSSSHWCAHPSRRP